MVSTLDFLYVVLAIGLIPTFTLVCLILYRIYKNMDRVDNIVASAEQVVQFTRNIDKVPAMVANKFISSVNRFISK